MLSIPDEIVSHIMHVSYPLDAYQLRLTCSTLMKLSIPKYSNKYKYGDVFRISRIQSEHETMLLAKYGHVRLLKYSRHPQECLLGGCEGGHKSVIVLAIKLGAKNYDSGLYKASLGGHLNVVKLMLNLGAKNRKSVSYGGCLGGHIEMVKFAINENKIDYNLCMAKACLGGHENIVKWMLDLGANDFEEGLCAACEGNKFGTAEMMLEYIPADSMGLIAPTMVAVNNGCLDILKLLYNHTKFDPNIYLMSACHNGKIEIVDMLLDLGATNFNMGFLGSCKGGHKDMAKYMVSKLVESNPSQLDLVDGFKHACMSGSIDMVEWFTDSGTYNLNEGMILACTYHNINIIKLLISLGANNFTEVLTVAINLDQLDIIELMISHGAYVDELSIEHIIYRSKIVRMLKCALLK